MIKQTNANLIQQLNEGSKIGLEYNDKKEFLQLTDYIFLTEKLTAIVVGGIETEPWLLALTDQRLLLVKKTTIYGSEVKQYGLEEILDLKFNSHGQKASLVFDLTQNRKLKVDSINHQIAKDFGRLIASNIYIWNANLTSYLL